MLRHGYTKAKGQPLMFSQVDLETGEVVVPAHCEHKTQQQHKEECDINSLLRRYEKTGIMTHLQKYEGRYGDFSGENDLYEAGLQIKVATDMFMELPAIVRQKFANNAGAFIDFVTDPDNKGSMKELSDMILGKNKEAEPTREAPAEPREAPEAPGGQEAT